MPYQWLFTSSSVCLKDCVASNCQFPRLHSAKLGVFFTWRIFDLLVIVWRTVHASANYLQAALYPMAWNAVISRNNHLLSFTTAALNFRIYENLFWTAVVPCYGVTSTRCTGAQAIAIIRMPRSTAHLNTGTPQRICTISAILACPTSTAATATAATNQQGAAGEHHRNKNKYETTN